MYWCQLEFEERHTDEYKQAINNSGDIGGTNLSRWGTEVGERHFTVYTHIHIHAHTC